MGGGDVNVGNAVPNNSETNSGDGNDNNVNNSNDVGYPRPDIGDAVGERKKQVKTGLQSKGGDDNNIGVDGPNHDDTNRGGDHDNVPNENRNNYQGKDIWDDDNVVGKTYDGDNGDGDNRNDRVNNIGDNDNTEVVIPPDRGGDALGDIISVSGTCPSPRSPREGTARTPIRWLQLINECDTPVDLEQITQSPANSLFPIIYCTTLDNTDDKSKWHHAFH